jgi:hypothetical protein
MPDFAYEIVGAGKTWRAIITQDGTVVARLLDQPDPETARTNALQHIETLAIAYVQACLGLGD